MNSQDFCYWLNGFFELTNPRELSEQQLKVIKEHLQLVFDKQTTETVTPSLKKEIFNDGKICTINNIHGTRYC